ncbi:unnamed protein product [Withania somnifera]
MESKAWIIVFLLLATSFETLMAQSERDKLRDGLEVIQLLKEVKFPAPEGKQRWPELLGVPVVLANKTILEQNPSITEIKILLNGSPVPLDLSYHRVRLFVNILDYVVQIPHVA